MAEKNGFFSRIKNLFTSSEIDDDFYDELEETLILSDVGVTASGIIIEELRRSVQVSRVRRTEQCTELLKTLLKDKMEDIRCDYFWEKEPSLLFIVGVNGVGKTTSIGKLAYALGRRRKKVLMAAADTFRAGAAEQLTIWAERSGADIISQHEGADPSAVLFDSISAARARRADVILCDTAGRLHNKKNLMQELDKMHRVVQREGEDFRQQTLIVLDATTGQNALNQARSFAEVTDVGGIILTKLDGTAKGGVVLAIQMELGLPIAYIGTGEKIQDLERFDADDFIERMFEE
ncbi:MAG: signal recognition particle-docking protein FtsY [Lachnospiraceae bacterium]|nr:signal recognition particle-docking protein FtsY [Lachnospiraceae bacterium]